MISTGPASDLYLLAGLAGVYTEGLIDFGLIPDVLADRYGGHYLIASSSRTTPKGSLFVPCQSILGPGWMVPSLLYISLVIESLIDIWFASILAKYHLPILIKP
jgi:hypothetical protein